MNLLKIKTTIVTLLLATGLAAVNLYAADSTVTGTFKGNGQDAKLAFVTAHKGDPFSGKQTTVVIMSQKKPAASAKPDIDAMLGKLGNTLMLTINSDGELISAQIIHSALKHNNFSSSGSIKLADYKLDKGVIQGHAATKGEKEFFGDKWAVDVTFKAKVL